MLLLLEATKEPMWFLLLARLQQNTAWMNLCMALDQSVNAAETQSLQPSAQFNLSTTKNEKN